MMDLAACVTPQELDAWLQSTEVHDSPRKKKKKHQQEQPHVPTVPSLRSSPATLPSPLKVSTSTEDEGSNKQGSKSTAAEKGGRRRSSKSNKRRTSLDESHHSFGVDERTLLAAARHGSPLKHRRPLKHPQEKVSNVPQENVTDIPIQGRVSGSPRRLAEDVEIADEIVRLVSESADGTDISPASSIGSTKDCVNRNAALTMQFTTSPLHPGLGRGIQGQGGLPPTTLHRKDSTGSRASSRTSASHETTVRNNFSRTVSDMDNNGLQLPLDREGYCNTPLDNNHGRGSIGGGGGTTPYPEDSSQGYARSVSLPTDCIVHPHELGMHNAPYEYSRRHSQPMMEGGRGGGGHHAAQDVSALVCAMEQSQLSHDESSTFTSRKSLELMRETSRTRGMLLRALGRTGSHGSTSRRGSCPASPRRASASSVIASHAASSHNHSGHRRASASHAMDSYQSRHKMMMGGGVMGGGFIGGSGSFGGGMGSWKQQDMRNVMLRSIIEAHEEEMMLLGRGGMKSHHTSHSFGSGHGRPSYKHHSFTSNDYTSKPYQYPVKPSSHQPQQELQFEESAVQAELDRIAREQMLEMERGGQSIF